ncbi:MAG: tannase/feruloyl esterase family alpha/beta hydrolase, partial [Acidobacteriaceae bacterium]|nr:tannase/feruloyl esterase family alpha/beta hydrolase [Acidobacteriaceae bacterium]
MRPSRLRPRALILFLLSFAPALRASDCSGLAQLSLPHVTVVTAAPVEAGDFTPPYGNTLHKLPPFCRFAGVLKPSADSYIRFEVWLPASGWNGKFLGAGNGGFAGAIDYGALGRNITHGYATAGTDTGHEASTVDASWAYHHPEKVIDFGYRALHLTVADAKIIIQNFYGRQPNHSYFDACSDGGREALMEAQRFPEDFDGILAGAPANYWTHLLAGGLKAIVQMPHDPAAYLSATKIPTIQKAALAACDKSDGLKDGIISNPEKCRFDPSVLLCKGVEDSACLTASEIESLKQIYSGAHDKNGGLIFPGLLPGAEEGPIGWSRWVTGEGPGTGLGNGFAENYFRYMVFEDPSWNPLTAGVDEAVHLADTKTAKALNAVDPDLSRFRARNGKLILYHGWNDPGISPWNTVNYFNTVEKRMGKDTVSGFV